jgi:ring-1,2-phenylacetyl-CoA epoxidase subunit PaaE
MAKAQIKMKFNGEIHNIDCNERETVLEAAMRNDIDVPYGCMAGTCNACQAHLNSGTVEMEYCDALTDDEIAQGEILTCQAHPTSEKIDVEYMY